MSMTAAAERLLSPGGLTVLLALALAILATASAGPFILVNTLVTGGMWALMAAGLAIIFGVMNIPNFAHGEFFMIGTLAAFLIYTPLKRALDGTVVDPIIPLVSILAAMVVGGVVGAVVDRAVFGPMRRRTREQWVMNTFLLTVGLSVMLINLHQLVWGTSYKGIRRYWDIPPVRILEVSIAFDRVMALLIALVSIGLFWGWLSYTQTGRAVRAAAQDETGAQMMGIDLGRIHTLTFALATALAALAGAALLFMFPSHPNVGLKPLYIAWTVVILAGLGNVGGAMIGGFMVALLQTVTSYFLGTAWEDVVPFVLIVIILIVRPSGLFGSPVKGVWEQ